jgi:DNA-binding winged helix-turn-helix (wHTH) protein
VRIRFGDCTFDSATRELIRGGQPRPLSPKAFLLLNVLLQERPRAVSQAELNELLWPKTYVARNSLFRVVSELREAIGDDAHEPRYMRTVHGFGYAFSGQAEEAPGRRARPLAACSIVWAGREIPLAEGANLIGRAPDCVVRIDSPRVSRWHARIDVADGKATIADLGSKNGTFLRGRRVDHATALSEGDEITAGPALLIFLAGGGMGSTESA